MSSTNFNSEEQLLSALRNGEHDALQYTYKSYWPMILRFVLLNNGTREDAEELYQDGIITLYEKCRIAGFKLTCSLKTYIYSICRNKWLNELRSRKKVLDIEAYIDNIAEDITEHDSMLPQQLEMSLAIANLGEPCRGLLIGYYYEKLSLDLLAKRMNYQNANVAKQQKFRCIERLKKMFAAQVIKSS